MDAAFTKIIAAVTEASPGDTVRLADVLHDAVVRQEPSDPERQKALAEVIGRAFVGLALNANPTLKLAAAAIDLGLRLYYREPDTNRRRPVCTCGEASLAKLNQRADGTVVCDRCLSAP